jgi:tetratricopeptide (TPR) repeat protein
VQQGRYDEAEEALLAALDKDPNNAETLINLVAVATYTGKAPEVRASVLIVSRWHVQTIAQEVGYVCSGLTSPMPSAGGSAIPQPAQG